MSIRIYMVTQCNEHPEVEIGSVESLEEGIKLVNQLDARWMTWEGDPTEDQAVRHYEGCDIYAHDSTTDITVWLNEDTEWEAS